MQDWKTRLVKTTGDPSNRLLHQLEFSANIRAYVDFVYGEVRTFGDPSKLDPSSLDNKIPFFGPQFLPPKISTTYRVHDLAPDYDRSKISLDFYLRPVTVLHPLYLDFASLIGCPNPNVIGAEHVIKWDSWHQSLPRAVHGLFEEGYAMGYQASCSQCGDASNIVEGAGAGKIQKSWTKTSPEYYKNTSVNKLPCEFLNSYPY